MYRKMTASILELGFTSYMEVHFSGFGSREDDLVETENKLLPQRDRFQYMGAYIKWNSGFECFFFLGKSNNGFELDIAEGWQSGDEPVKCCTIGKPRLKKKLYGHFFL